MAEGRESLIEQVRSGSNRELVRLAATGLLPLAAEELIPLQVELARQGDSELAEIAAKALAKIEPRMLASFLASGAGPDVLAFCAERLDHPVVLEAILRRRDVPRRILVDLAARIPSDLQEVLILRQDAIVEAPAILDALERNPRLATYAERRIQEYREHLLPRVREVGGDRAAVEEAPDEVVAAALAEVKRQAPAGEVDEQTGLSESQIRMLPVSVRLRLTRGASRSLRNVLIRDPVAQVAVAAIQNGAYAESEIEALARSRSVVDEVLAVIASRREWVGKYPICKALVSNPRTPLVYSMKLINRLTPRDLKDLARDRNIPDAVRSSASRLYRIKLQ